MDAMTLPANRSCPIANTLAVLGQKWSLLLLREAFLGRTRYAEFRRIGIPTDVLAARLTGLVEAGLLDRRPYRETGERTRDEYVLTPAGQDAIGVLAALSEWGTEHLPLPDGARIGFAEKETGHPVHLRFVTDDGRQVDNANVTTAR